MSISIHNKIKDIFKDTPWGEISRLVVPQVLLMLTTLLIGLTDMWVAGRISSEVQAVIGISAQIQAIIMVLAMSLGSGAMAVVSQSFGAKRYERAKRYIALVLYITLFIALGLSLFAKGLGAPLMDALGIEKETQPMALIFWDILLLSLPFHYIYFVSNIFFRASKLVKLPLFIGLCVCLVNMFGDLAFGLGYFGFPNYGVKGVAWTTCAAVFVGAFVSLVLLKKADLLPKKFMLKYTWIKHALPYLLKVASPALLNQGLWQSGYLILFGITASVPNSIPALAGLSAGMRIESILFTPAIAFNATASIMVGFMLGEGNVQGAKSIGLKVFLLGASIMSFVALCMFPFRQEFAEIFSSDPVVINIIVWYLVFNILSTPFTIGSMIFSGILTGAGATIYSLFINSSSAWLVRLPLAYVLAHTFGLEEVGVFLAMFLSTIFQCLVHFLVFLKCAWYDYAQRGKQNKIEKCTIKN